MEDKKKNYSGKKKKYQDSRDKEKSLKSTSGLGSLFNTYPVKMIAANSSMQTSGTISSMAAKVDIYVPIGRVLVEEPWPLIQDQVTSIINGYAASRGGVATVTESVIEEILERSVDAFALFLNLFRTQNILNLRWANGLSAAALFTTRIRTATGAMLTGNTVLQQIYDSTVASTATDATGLTSAAWMQTYVTRLRDIYLTPVLFNQLIALFGAYYTSPGAIDSYIAFNAAQANANTTFAALFVTEVNAILALINANPDAIAILNQLGFSNQLALGQDWTRDLKGTTLLLNEDPEIGSILSNSGVLDAFWDSIKTDADVADIYYDLFGNASHFMRPDYTDVSVGSFFLQWLIGKRYHAAGLQSYAANHVVIMKEDGTLSLPLIVNSCSVSTLAGSGSDANRVQFITNLINAMSQMKHLALIGPWYEPSLNVNVDVGVTIVLTAAALVTYGSLDSANMWKLPADFGTIMLSASVSNLFGSEYRAKLQLILNSMAHQYTSIK